MDVDREFRGLAPLKRPLAAFAGTFLPARSLPTPVLSCYLRPRYSALSRDISANSLSTSCARSHPQLPLTSRHTAHDSNLSFAPPYRACTPHALRRRIR